MKILHIIPTLGMGGAEKLLVDLLQISHNYSVYVDVAVLSNYDNIYEEQVQQSCNRYFSSTSKSVYSLSNIFFIKKILKAGQYDIVHCHLYAAQLFTPIAKLFANSKTSLVTTEHSTSNRRRNNKLFKLLDVQMYNQYEKIICISEGTREELNSYLPQLREKISVIHNGIPLHVYRDSKAEDWRQILTDYQNEKIVLMVASFRYQKDPRTLIRAAKLLGPTYRIVFVGDGESLEETKTFADDEVNRNIEFLGKRHDVPALMKSADIFVLSSKSEGFGLVVVEAAASGLPIIGSNVAGLREVVLDLGGQIFEVGNEKDLVLKIKTADAIQKSSVSQINKYDILHTSSAYMQIYKQLFEEKEGS